MKRPPPLRRGRSSSTARFNREEQIGLALHLVQYQPRGAPHEVPGRDSSAFADLQIVEREVETILEKGFGLRQRALAGLASAHQHHDRRSGEGTLQQESPKRLWAGTVD